MMDVITPRWIQIERDRLSKEADALHAPQADLNAAPMSDLRAPQRRINANQIEADEYAAAWRRVLAFGAPLVGLALLAVLLIVTAVRAEDKLGADLTLYHQFRSMK